MAGNNEWSRISLPITVANANNQLEFRVYWHGQPGCGGDPHSVSRTIYE